MHFILNVTGALVMGALIGLERQFRQHPAGLRTNALVSVGSALFVSLSQLIDNDGSPTRIAGQVVSGIGFLGGGVILREGFNVRGMNTAATLWCSAAIGTLAGSGFLWQAAFGTAAIIATHLALRPIVKMVDAQSKTSQDVDMIYQIKVVCENEQTAAIRTIFLRHVNSQPNMSIHGIATRDAEKEGTSAVVVDIYSSERQDKYLNEIVTRISIEPSVTSVGWERSQ
jgi:putative Mg2+ transporter-C (MgtC) family protein